MRETIATKLVTKDSLIDSRFSEVSRSKSLKLGNNFNGEDIKSDLALHYFNQPYQ